MEVTATYPSKANFVTKIMEAANAVLSILEVVVLDESESAKGSVGEAAA
jgi:hypothetical protein